MVCQLMAEHGVLTKETHLTTLRFAPPLIIEEADLLQAIEIFAQSLEMLAPVRRGKKALSSLSESLV
jgi:ornithine--oxo-acid transaminase